MVRVSCTYSAEVPAASAMTCRQPSATRSSAISSSAAAASETDSVREPFTLAATITTVPSAAAEAVGVVLLPEWSLPDIVMEVVVLVSVALVGTVLESVILVSGETSVTV